jgi:carboxylate-amine ligase
VLVPTLGVEEEFLLLDPAGGRPVGAAPAVLRLFADEPAFQAELMRFQLETRTRVCSCLPDLRGELVRLRRLAAAGAESLNCRLVASGVSPYGTPGLAALTDGPRYQELARRHPFLTAIAGTCGCHVHVAVPSRDLGVQVLARLRPWLATLLALSANSPIDRGRDTGSASLRYRLVRRWPTAQPPAVWPDAERYDAAVRRLIRRGAAVDERSVYFLARLSPRYPTIEVRVPDVCPDIDTTLLVAALVRAVVVTSLTESRQGVPPPAIRRATLDAGLMAAARAGLAGTGVDPFTGRTVPQRLLLDRLLSHAGGALAETGDEPAVQRLLGLLDGRGTGADRQRRRWACASGAAGFVEALTQTTVTEPAELPASIARETRWPEPPPVPSRTMPAVVSALFHKYFLNPVMRTVAGRRRRERPVLAHPTVEHGGRPVKPGTGRASPAGRRRRTAPRRPVRRSRTAAGRWR